MVLTLVGLGVAFFFCALAEFIAAHVLQASRCNAEVRQQFRIPVRPNLLTHADDEMISFCCLTFFLSDDRYVVHACHNC